MINKSPILCALLALAALAWQAPAFAQAAAAAPASQAAARGPAPARAPASQYSKEGADTCLGCHDDESSTYSAKAIFRTKHAARGDKRAPFGAGGLQCEACHGPGAEHSRTKKTPAINTFKADSSVPLAQRNQACLACHEGASRSSWHASVHDRNSLACTDCHKIHVERDPVLTRSTEPETCYRCHQSQRASFQNTSAHPVRFGKMACGDCHNPHGSSSQAMLVKPTLNQTCYTCHADKRGPLLWEHAPVPEDCSLCHSPHGSVRAALLNKSPPWLCQQCHSQANHPSLARTGAGLPSNGGAGAIFLVAGSCTNCHSQVHGSNHPAGAKLMR